MEQRRPEVPQYTLEVFADPTLVKDIVKGILHAIFFHRYFMAIAPLSREVLDQTLPAVDDVDLETLIDQRVTSLVHSILSPAPNNGGSNRAGAYSHSNNGQSPRAQIAVQFYEKKRRKTYFSFGKGEEEICWEQWTLDVTCATPRTESDRTKVRAAMDKSLARNIQKIIDLVNRDKDHIPPITVAEKNPFPYQILVNPRAENWSTRMSIF